MLQNSRLFSVYGRARSDLANRLPPPARVAALVEDEYGDVLAGVRIEIYLIERRGWSAEDRAILQAYWSEVFRQLGVREEWRAL